MPSTCIRCRWRRRTRCLFGRSCGHCGPTEALRDAGGPVTRLVLGPKSLVPPIVVVTSPHGGHDMVGRTDAYVDKTVVHRELRNILGDNLFTLPHDEWLPRRRSVQHVFTKQHVKEFGGHMSQRSDAIAEPLQTALSYAADRAMRPFRAPSWLPTPARWRARQGSRMLHELARDILAECRRDPDRDAPLVRALMAATDRDTGRPLADDVICNELMVFIGAGHDTTATTLAYSLWQLGRHRHLQDRVRAEVDALGHRTPTPDDVPALTYTAQVLHEALRLCPPAAGLAREAKCDIAVDGYRVEAGSVLLFGIWAVQRDPALWPNALTFDPGRFTPEKRKQIDRWQYLPFGAGPRSCIGDHFAMLEATLALATIIGRCQITSLADEFPVAVPFTTVAAGPVPVRVGKR